MSNERIDLTQFRIMTGSPPDEVDLMARHNFTLGQAEVLVQLPDLIAELKRCYKLLDDADNAMSRYGDEEEHQDINNVCDAYEAVCNALAG